MNEIIIKKLYFIIILLNISGSIYLLYNKKKFLKKINNLIIQKIKFLKGIKRDNFLIYYKLFLDH